MLCPALGQPHNKVGGHVCNVLRDSASGGDLIQEGAAHGPLQRQAKAFVLLGLLQGSHRIHKHKQRHAAHGLLRGKIVESACRSS